MEGTSLAQALLADATARARRFEQCAGRRPCLAAVLVGDDPSSVTYVRMKRNRCEKAGIESRFVPLPATTTTGELVATIAGLSGDPGVDGILLQHPVPDHIDERAAFEAIAPAKDVDGVTMHSFAWMSLDDGPLDDGSSHGSSDGPSGPAGFASCTPSGIVRLLDHYEVPIAGSHAVIVGRSPILGKPVGMLLLGRDATVTFCHSKTQDLASVVRTGDIVVAAVGRANFIRGSWLKPGAVVVDAGYNEGNVGDVAFDEAVGVARLITPVPGGVGPMTIAVLLAQTVDAAERRSTA
jgi:methylenetetrahydrofolate dehydrogenase (NADP+)/methenyltetrahydrofolate cyclohydrolase